jgi:hypothetical protein
VNHLNSCFTQVPAFIVSITTSDFQNFAAKSILLLPRLSFTIDQLELHMPPLTQSTYTKEHRHSKVVMT